MPSLRWGALILAAVLVLPAAAAAAPPPLTLDPGERFHLRVTGLRPVPAMAPAGDVNGDGLPDVLVGARERDAVFVVFGTRERRTVDVDALGSAGVRIAGVQSGDGAGDVNRDGLGDLVLLDDTGDDASGYVVFGRRGSAPVDVRSLGGRGFRIVGAPNLATAAAVGDVNGDGTPDVVFAANARWPDQPGDRAFVVFGKASLTPVNLSTLGSKGFEIRMLPHGSLGGGATAEAAGDVDGDGLADVAVGSPSWELYAGLAWIVYGRTSTDPVVLQRGTTRDALFYEGGADNAGYGSSTAGIGDFDGNGHDDVAFAVNWGVRGPLVAFGPEGAPRWVLSAVGFDYGDSVLFETYRVSAAGDVNGDGHPDLIGLAYSPSFRPPAGAWVVFGGPHVDASSFSLAGDGFVIPMDYGGAVGVGDMTGDGAGDLAVTKETGDVWVAGWDPPCTRTGTAGSDVLVGTPGQDVICAGAGNDRVDGRGGDDVVLGGPGNDRLLGAAGDDSLAGGAGRDTLLGGPGRNGLHGGPGPDELTGGGGQELLQGDTGDDRLSGGDGLDMGSGGPGRDTVSAGPGNDRMTGGDDADVLRGDAGSDDLRGDDGPDLLAGGLGADNLLGGPGDDRLYGGEDGDQLEGDTGQDLLSGDAGWDALDGLEYLDVGGYNEHVEPRIAPPARDELRCGPDGGEAGMADELDAIAASC